jgi:hypothetical protein
MTSLALKTEEILGDRESRCVNVDSSSIIKRISSPQTLKLNC